MKKLIILLSLLSLINCKNNDNMKSINQNLHITVSNIEEEIAKEVKNYPSEKIYKIRHESEYCLYEIYINDMSIFRNFDFNVPDAFEFNHLVFKSGSYKVKYKLYPVEKNEIYLKTYDSLVDETELNLTLKSYDKKNEQADDIEYLTYEVPKIEKKVTDYYSEYTFVGSGKTYYEGSFDINIDVPYNIIPPFANAQDLRKMDRKELEKKVLKEYQKLRQIYLNKEKDNIARLLYDNLRILSITNYSSKKEIQEMWEEVTEILFKNDIEILPIENYKLDFFADGRLVALFTDGTNPKTRGGNALICRVKSGKFKGTVLELKHYFYIPEGETEFKVY